MEQAYFQPSDSDLEHVLNVEKERNLSEWTLENYKTTLKKFYSWYLDEENPECVKWIKRNNSPDYRKKPDFKVKPEERDVLFQACDNHRDNAIFSQVYDSGIRIVELHTLRMRDVVFDDYGMKFLYRARLKQDRSGSLETPLDILGTG